MQSNTDWSYLAAIFDGEGSIGGTRYPRFDGKYHYFQTEVQLNVKNTDLKLMKWLIAHFGGVYYTLPHDDKPNWSPAHVWRPKGKKNKELILLGIMPYLLMKTEQATLALEFLALPLRGTTKRREEIVARLNFLNLRGKSVETNTLEAEQSVMIESDLIGDNESAPVVTQDA